MTVAIVLDIGTQALVMVALLAGPLLAAGLIVGLSVGVFQAVTQIHWFAVGIRQCLRRVRFVCKQRHGYSNN